LGGVHANAVDEEENVVGLGAADVDGGLRPACAERDHAHAGRAIEDVLERDDLGGVEIAEVEAGDAARSIGEALGRAIRGYDDGIERRDVARREMRDLARGVGGRGLSVREGGCRERAGDGEGGPAREAGQ
jgi:hypothetical protein